MFCGWVGVYFGLCLARFGLDCYWFGGVVVWVLILGLCVLLVMVVFRFGCDFLCWGWVWLCGLFCGLWWRCVVLFVVCWCLVLFGYCDCKALLVTIVDCLCC